LVGWDLTALLGHKGGWNGCRKRMKLVNATVVRANDDDRKKGKKEKKGSRHPLHVWFPPNISAIVVPAHTRTNTPVSRL